MLSFLVTSQCHDYDPGEEGDEAELEAPKIYEMIESFDQLEDKLKMYEEQYNETVRGSKMDLVFFKVISRKCICSNGYRVLFRYFQMI